MQEVIDLDNAQLLSTPDLSLANHFDDENGFEGGEFTDLDWRT